MVARWDRLPPEARVKRPRRASLRLSYRCAGAGGCGEVLVDVTSKQAEMHADLHGGARLEVVQQEVEG